MSTDIYKGNISGEYQEGFESEVKRGATWVWETSLTKKAT